MCDSSAFTCAVDFTLAVPLVQVAGKESGPWTVTVQLIDGTLMSKVQPDGRVTLAGESACVPNITCRVTLFWQPAPTLTFAVRMPNAVQPE